MKSSSFFGLLRQAIHLRRYNRQTEVAYLGWIRRFIQFHELHHASDITPNHVEPFLEHLAASGQVTEQQQTQALCALIFAYRHVLNINCSRFERHFWARNSPQPPKLLTRHQINALLGQLPRSYALLMALIYHTGLRLSECLTLRIKDIRLSAHQLKIENSQQNEAHTVEFPVTLDQRIHSQIKQVTALHQDDITQGVTQLALPPMVTQPSGAFLQLGWQFLFPAQALAPQIGTGQLCRFHLHPWTVNHQLIKAARQCHINRTVTWQSFMHSHRASSADSSHLDTRLNNPDDASRKSGHHEKPPLVTQNDYALSVKERPHLAYIATAPVTPSTQLEINLGTRTPVGG